uniref:Uncharacterized protein n=1 Tax=Amphimedon queenslandica TaxID=400682 RepID=A0A1X7UEP4_AMPQE
IPLDDDQDEEMEAVVTSIEQNCSNELEKLFVEGDKHGVGSIKREVWKSDKERNRKEFQEDQLRNKSGKRNNRWSSITICLALSVYVRSPAAYETLKSFKILVPGRSTQQAYTSAFLHEPGANNAYIEDQ